MSVRVRTAPISIGHLPISLCSVRVGTTPISIGHCLASSVWVFRIVPISINHLHVNSMSVWVFRVTPISIGHLPISLCLVQVFWDRTYIDRSFPCQLEFLRPRLCRSVIHLVFNLSFRMVPISISYLPCQFEFLGPHLYRSAIFLSICVQFELSGLHLYRSIIHLVSLVFGTTPISIDHLPISLHLGSSWDCIYIDLSSSCQLEF